MDLAFVRLMDLVVVLLYLSVVMLVAGLCEADGCYILDVSLLVYSTA
jgi:hypothetical protein